MPLNAAGGLGIRSPPVWSMGRAPVDGLPRKLKLFAEGVKNSGVSTCRWASQDKNWVVKTQWTQMD